MAKINVPFNGITYPIDETKFSEASSELQSHLSSIMKGTGDSVEIDEVAYESIKSAVGDLRTVLSGMSDGGSATVLAPGVIPIPDSGNIEYIYVNRDLSVAEIDSIIENYINNNTGVEMYWSGSNMLLYPIFINSWGDNYLFVANNDSGDGYMLGFRHNYGSELFYNSTEGWVKYNSHWFNENNSFNASELSNVENYLKDKASEKGFTYNTDLIKGLLSATPSFDDAKNIPLNGEYSGVVLRITENDSEIDIIPYLEQNELPLSIKTKIPSFGELCSYFKYGDGVQISDYFGNATELRIPAGIDIYPIVSINNLIRWNETVTKVVIPNTVTEVGSSFIQCSALTSVVMGRNVSTIYGAFSNCPNLAVVDFQTTTIVPTLNSTDAFSGVPSTCKVVIPDDLYDTWTTAVNWSDLTIIYVRASEYVEE